MTPQEIIAVVQAHIAGKPIEARRRTAGGSWFAVQNPCWNFEDVDYRVAPEKPQTVFLVRSKTDPSKVTALTGAGVVSKREVAERVFNSEWPEKWRQHYELVEFVEVQK